MYQMNELQTPAPFSQLCVQRTARCGIAQQRYGDPSVCQHCTEMTFGQRKVSFISRLAICASAVASKLSFTCVLFDHGTNPSLCACFSFVFHPLTYSSPSPPAEPPNSFTVFAKRWPEKALPYLYISETLPLENISERIFCVDVVGVFTLFWNMQLIKSCMKLFESWCKHLDQTTSGDTHGEVLQWAAVSEMTGVLKENKLVISWHQHSLPDLKPTPL